MLRAALICLTLAVVAGALGMAGMAAFAIYAPWGLFVAGVILLGVHAATRGRVPPPT